MAKEKQESASTALRFGIPKQEYEKAEIAASLQSIYDFDDDSSEEAFYISNKFGISLKRAFEIVWQCLKEEENSK